MAVRTKLTTKGLEETLEALAKAGADLDAAVAEGLKAGGQVLLDGMLERVPRDTGNLAGNLSIAGPFLDESESRHYMYVGLNRGVDAETARYGAAQEYGTKSTPPQSFLRATVDADLRRARAEMIAVVKARLERK